MESTQPTELADAVASEIPAVPQTDSSAKKPTESVGRTGWDLLAEFRAGRAQSTQGPPINWYRIAFFSLLVVGLIYAAIHVRAGFDSVTESIRTIASGVDEVRGSAAATTKAAERIERQFQSTPSVATSFVHHELDVPACKARSLETLQRAKVTSIDVTQYNAITGTVFSPSAATLSVLVVCTPHKVVFVVVSGRDDRETQRVRDQVANELLRASLADAAAKPASAPGS